ncbi:MAG TPA: OadG family protein [Candidatus Avimuribaculum pullicola]|nr:OadG family protein [Candidatus Avimuribaculum pullicola]
MKIKGIALLLLLCFTASIASFAQGRRGLYINEVMVQNDSNYVDDYGLRHGWIELYNSTYNHMEISTVFLTNDSTNPTKYPVPRGDVHTDIPARQHVLFFADNEPNKGTFHISFSLTLGKENWIGLYDTDGKTLLDQVYVPADLKANQTYALKADGVTAGDGKFDPAFWEVRDGSNEKYITPSSNNVIIDTNENIEKFRTHDSSGIVMTIVAMLIVFSALILLSLCFYLFGYINSRSARRKKAIAHLGEEAGSEVAADKVRHDSGEEIAAIAMALYEHLNTHDLEETILTINKVKRTYSPWSSKIYMLRETPVRR